MLNNVFKLSFLKVFISYSYHTYKNNIREWKFVPIYLGRKVQGSYQ